MPRPAGQRRSLYFEHPGFAATPCPSPARQHCPVVVVGGGPVGLCTALVLARHGVAAVVIEPRNTVSDGSRAICIARHSLEILQQLGLDQVFCDKALPWTHGTTYYRDRAVYRLAMPHDDDERFFPMYNLQQQYIEAYLAAAAAAEPLVELRRGHRVEALAVDDEGGATLRVACAAGDYVQRARYVVAADGARSRVREALGLSLHGAAYEARYVIVDVQMRSTHPTERRAYFDSAANPGATLLVHRQPDDIWRIDYQLADDEDEEAALTEGAIRARLQPILALLGERDACALEWWSLYKAYMLCLDDYRVGPVFFAGDAAHLVPIFGVRGLNSGFADAADIGWKLAWVLHGRASSALLDSYTPERRGATLDIFEQAGRSTRFMAPPSSGYRLLRDAALALAEHHPAVRELLDPRQSQLYTYADSPLTTAAAIGAPTPRPGATLGNARLADGSFLLDHLGAGFTLLGFGLDVTACGALVREAASRQIPLKILNVSATASADATTLVDVDGRLAARHAARPGAALLVRPDRHVCAGWAVFEPTLAVAALERALGWATA